MKRIAEALVECGYAQQVTGAGILTANDDETGTLGWYEDVNPFADTLEGRRQADALIDFLIDKHNDLWGESKNFDIDLPNGFPNWREYINQRIAWCFEQLEKQE